MIGDRYRILRKVGEGAMGEVFEAEHIHMNRRVAIKLLQRKLATDPEAMRRLQREAQSTGGIGHPNIVEGLDFGFTEDGQAFLVMEWLEGESLDRRLETGPLDLETAIEIGEQAAAGLAEAHERGVIHRDLKPANLFLTHDRKNRLVVKVVDFGIAKLGAEQTKLTSTGVVIGTPVYMAPEQATGDPVDVRTDVYALGVILYEMFAGVVPFSADTALAILHQHTTRSPAPPSVKGARRGITPALDAIVMRCLAKRPADRFASMIELRELLVDARKHLNEASTPPIERAAAHDELDEAPVPVPRSRRTVFVVLCAAILVVAGAVAFAVVKSRGTPSSAPPRVGADAIARDNAIAVAPDAATIDAVPIDTTGSIDAAVSNDAAVAIDAASLGGIVAQGRGRHFGYRIYAPAARPDANQPFELVVVLDLEHDLKHALEAQTLEARLTLEYFRDHSVAHDSTAKVGADGQLVIGLRLAHVEKHHSQLRLLVSGKEVDAARFDLFR